MKFIVKLFPEIIIKSRPVRLQQLKRLKTNMRIILKAIHPAVRVGGNWDVLEVDAGADCPAAKAIELSDALTRIPGIANFTEAKEYPLGDFDTIAAQSLEAVGDALNGKTFRVRVKRSGNHEFRSVDLERHVGSVLNHNTAAAGVNLKDPDVSVTLEVRKDRLFIVSNRREGMGGYPLGTQEYVATLISGGYDSSVAAWQMMRRGLCTHFIFFNLGGQAHEDGVKEIAHFLWHRFGASHPVTFVSVPFEPVVEEILTQVDNSHMGVVLKRQMMQAADKIAERLGAVALVTGEAIAQVSSQTLINLQVIDRSVDRLILRPLITSDKQVIIDQAKAIGAAAFSEVMPEYCGVISRRPTTRARQHIVEHEEQRMNEDVLQWAIDNAVFESIQDVIRPASAITEVPMGDPTNTAAVVLDVRHPDDVERAPVSVVGHDVQVMPFYRVQSGFAALDQDREYWLYCPKGVMSKLQALQLQDAGYKNVRMCPLDLVQQ
ncbi:tRNA 4-thiouridine(8) synthase ThiI [Salinispirillum sp. LH 10-3-1]|uniref:tRNA sulfurtransferase n=1 Tax=Salinispirillum sp. LH 10-3-1 TaxID=2952525 RepID=A0AB38YHA5_9GAMM